MWAPIPLAIPCLLEQPARPSSPGATLWVISCRHTWEIRQDWWQVWGQTTAVKQMSHESESRAVFGFPVHRRVMFTLYCSLVSVQ